MRFIEGYSCKQVAKGLSLSESNVRVIQYRALKKLKEYLK
jgi:DNA-directed RNA polymerase specialized sigma24 family protein